MLSGDALPLLTEDTKVMHTVVWHVKHRLPVKALLYHRNTERPSAATAFLGLAFALTACASESTSPTSVSPSSSEPSGDSYASSETITGPAVSPTPSASDTDASETATLSGNTSVGSTTSVGATSTSSGGSGSLGVDLSSAYATTGSTATSLGSAETSSPNSSEDGTTSTGASETASESSTGSEGQTSNEGALAPSCADDGRGRSNCGVNADESCCESPLVPSGTYFRTYENTGDGPSAQADEATLTTVRLDKYEVSVGRFRSFVEYLEKGGSPPAAGSGKHTHLNAGQGLTDSGAPGSFEPGWDPSWNELIPSGAGAAASWRSLLTTGVNGNSGCGLYGTWTEEPGANEELPITCTSWYESYAFCIWDGGFLPSEAEWRYAAAGGDEYRMYPWGTTEPGSDNEYAIIDCCYPDSDCSTSAGVDTCTGTINAAPVGFAGLGAGRYGQLDMIGNVFEWTLDRYGEFDSPCEDCALLTANTSDRVLPGAGFHTSLGLGSTILYAWNRASVAWDADTFRGDYAVGLRCARSP